MAWKTFITKLTQNLSRELPGLDAQLKMSPPSRSIHLRDLEPGRKPVKAGVLILLYQENEAIKIPLIKRPVYDGVHSGQMAFPGGKIEDQDASLLDTALRESKEEIGILPQAVNIIGPLSELFIPPSNYLVTPYVGFINTKPEFKIDKSEVDQLIVVDLAELLAPNARQEKQVLTGLDIYMHAPCYYVQNQIIWGATAMIISEFNEVIRHT